MRNANKKMNLEIFTEALRKMKRRKIHKFCEEFDNGKKMCRLCFIFMLYAFYCSTWHFAHICCYGP